MRGFQTPGLAVRGFKKHNRSFRAQSYFEKRRLRHGFTWDQECIQISRKGLTTSFACKLGRQTRGGRGPGNAFSSRAHRAAGSSVLPSRSWTRGRRGPGLAGGRRRGTRPGPALRWSGRCSAAAPHVPAPQTRAGSGAPWRRRGSPAGTWSSAHSSFPAGWLCPCPSPHPPIQSPSQILPAPFFPSRFPREKHGREQ